MEILEILESLGLGEVKEDRNDYLVICPFHDDINPSLRIHKEKGLVNCFGGCIHGNIFDLISRSLNIDREEAKRRYRINDLFSYESWANKFRYKLETSRKEIKQSKNDLISFNFQNFIPAVKSEIAKTYLFSRNLTLETIKSSRILYNIKYREVAIPVFGKDNKLNTFINRSIEKKQYRYISGFPISDYLFGINLISNKTKECYLVEGAFDQIKLYQEGLRNTLAILHSDISQKQIDTLKKYFSEVNLMLDSDDAGKKASEKISQKLIQEGLIVYIIDLKEGKDPDEHTKEEILNRIENKKLIWRLSGENKKSQTQN